MCQIQNLLTQGPEEHLPVTDDSPKVHNAVSASPLRRPSATAGPGPKMAGMPTDVPDNRTPG